MTLGFHMCLRRTLLSIAALVGCVFAAQAADIPAELRVDQVTVYRAGAIVTRAGSVNIPAGTHRLIIKGLPAGIEAKSLRIAVESSAIRLGGIDIARINEGKFVSEAERDLRRKIEDKSDERMGVQDEIATAETQLKLLDSLAATPAGNSTKASVDGANLGSVLTTMSNSATASRKHIRTAKVQLRLLDREIDKLKADLNKVATQSKQSTEVRAVVQANAASTSTITVTYAINDAGWQWIYEARLDTNKKRITFARQGQVQQGSGEDWKDVELTLTTAVPSNNIATPIVSSLFLNLEQPRPPPVALAASANIRRAQADLLQGVPVSISTFSEQKITAQVLATDYLAEYKIPARVSLLADREPRLYPVANDAFDVDLVARVVPKTSHAAYLEATFKYQQDNPIEAGQLQLYRDGAFVGEAATKVFLPGAEVRMPFGADERIRVAVHDEQAQSAQRGIVNKQMVKETRQRFEITSYHPTPIAVEVIDRLPVSKHADVHIETIKGATEPTTKDLDGKAGVMLWKFDAQPQKTTAIHHYYLVRYPKDHELAASEEGSE